MIQESCEDFHRCILIYLDEIEKALALKMILFWLCPFKSGTRTPKYCKMYNKYYLSTPCKQVRMTFEFQFRFTSASTWWLTVGCVWPWTPSTTVDGVTWPIIALVTRSVQTSGWIEMIPARIPKYSGYRYVFLSHALKWTNKFCITNYFEFLIKKRPLDT